MYAYDHLNRLKSETITLPTVGAKSRTYTYDAQGNLSESVDRNGRKRTFTYDWLDRIVVERWYDGAGTQVEILGWVYDELGRVTYQASFGANNYEDGFHYDHLGRITQRASGDVAAEEAYTVHQYEYDVLTVSDGHLYVRTNYTQSTINNTGETYDLVGGGTLFTDRLGRLVKVTDASTGGGAKQLEFTYNTADELTGIHRQSGSFSLDTSLAYDRAGRLTALVHDLPTDIAHLYEYDRASRVTSFDTTGGLQRDYGYDDAGQVTSATGLVGESFTYDQNGNRAQASGQTVVTGAYNRVTDDGAYTYEYDAEGNLTKRTQKSLPIFTTEYRWDHRNRLVEVLFKTSGTVTSSVQYTYDVDNRRVGRRVDADGPGPQAAVNEHFSYDASGELVLSLGHTGQVEHRYLYGPAVDQVLADEAFSPAGAVEDVLWQLADQQGSIRDIVDGSGVLRKHVEYGVAGKVLSETWYGAAGQQVVPTHTEAVDQLFYYTGLARDAKTGFLRAGRRDYDPQTGRWTSEDPLGFADGANVYRYAGNSYPNATDPTGLKQAGNPLNNLFGGPTYSAQQLFGGVGNIKVTRDLQAGPLDTGLAIAGNLVDVQSRRGATANEINRLQTAVARGYDGSGRNPVNRPAYEREIRNQQLILKTQNSDITLFQKQLNEGYKNTVVPNLSLGRDDNRFLPGGVGPQAIIQRHQDNKIAPALSRVDALGSVHPEYIPAAFGAGFLQGGVRAGIAEAFGETTGLPVNIRYVSEGRPLAKTSRQQLAFDYEDSLIGSASDVATGRRIVPALDYANPNPRGNPYVRFDGVDPLDPLTLIDRKLNVTTHSGQLDQFRRQANALSQNPGYGMRIEVPDARAANAAQEAIRRANIPGAPITVRVVPFP